MRWAAAEVRCLASIRELDAESKLIVAAARSEAVQLRHQHARLDFGPRMEPEGEPEAEPRGVRDDIGEAERELVGPGKEQPYWHRDAELVLGRREPRRRPV